LTPIVQHVDGGFDAIVACIIRWDVDVLLASELVEERKNENRR